MPFVWTVSEFTKKDKSQMQPGNLPLNTLFSQLWIVIQAKLFEKTKLI